MSSTVIQLIKTTHGKCAVCGDDTLLEYFDLDLNSAEVCTVCVSDLDNAQSALAGHGMRKVLKGER